MLYPLSYGDMEPQLRIELRPHPYQGCALPLCYCGKAGRPGVRPHEQARGGDSNPTPPRVSQEGVEPPTSSFVAKRSNPLSY
jgi:hypothetical protein